jgi:hypothetical protein
LAYTPSQVKKDVDILRRHFVELFCDVGVGPLAGATAVIAHDDHAGKANAIARFRRDASGAPGEQFLASP